MRSIRRRLQRGDDVDFGIGLTYIGRTQKGGGRMIVIDKNLPKTNISLDTNTVKLSADALSKIKLDPAFVSKIEQLEEKSSKVRKKKLY